jgi:hypothetical protein
MTENKMGFTNKQPYDHGAVMSLRDAVLCAE